ncbi:hypothetical protein TNCV_188241 [Trichonephila clavipes]|nr:hypothetical protein TNCV_188241 [Trichonephila clavipes]
MKEWNGMEWNVVSNVIFVAVFACSKVNITKQYCKLLLPLLFSKVFSKMKPMAQKMHMEHSFWLEEARVRLGWNETCLRTFSRTATAGSDVVQSERPIFDDFFQHLWPYIGNNTANVVFQMVKRLWLIRIDQ